MEIVPPQMPQMTVSMPPKPALPPKNTIYINNLNEKIKLDNLKKSLYAIFAQFGEILKIMVSKSLAMRGQAFIVFNELSNAEEALRSMQSFPFFDKPMRIQFAKLDADVISKRIGTFVDRPKRRRDEDSQVAKAAKKKKLKQSMAAAAAAASAHQHHNKKGKKSSSSAATGGSSSGAGGSGGSTHSSHAGGGSGGTTTHHPINPNQMPEQPPNKILFITNLPETANDRMLTIMFSQFTGFREVRMVPSRKDIAFVEFDAESQAGVARSTLQGFKIEPTHAIRITFAKK